MAYSNKQKEEIFNTICKEMAEGKSLRSILQRKSMPDTHTFYKWIDEDEEKLQRYARASEERTDFYADEILEIADNQNADVYVDDEGNVKVDGQIVQRAKLQIDTRKWLMAKLQPKKYGDKNTTVIEGGDKPIEISFED